MREPETRREPDGIGRANQALFTRLTRIVDEIDPVPELVYTAARAAFEMRGVDAEMAALVRDSAAEPRSLATVRGELSVRLLCFEAAELEIDLQVVPQAARRSLVGQVVGPVLDVRVHTTEGIVVAALDEHGRFQVDDVPAGRLRLQVDAAGTTYLTDWVRV